MRGKTIVAAYENFVSSYDNVESAQFGLDEAARNATSGEILYEGETEKMRMAPKKRKRVQA